MKTIIASVIFLHFVIGLSQVGSCSGEKLVDAQKQPTKSLNTEKYATIAKTCAPWDGPALVIYITSTPQKCSEKNESMVLISVYKGIDKVSGKEISFPDEKLGMIRKVENGKGVDAKKATVRFEQSDDKSDVKFVVDIEFADGEKLKGRFSAKWCENKFVCG